jgi:hypothetical protein
METTAERYPTSMEPHLSFQADSTLHAIVGDIRLRILQELHSQQIALDGIRGNSSDVPDSPVDKPPCEPWQSQGVRAADLLWDNEKAAEQFYAPGPSGGAALRDTDLVRRLSSLTKTLMSVLRVSCLPK